MGHEFTEQGNNNCVCLSFSVEGMRWRPLLVQRGPSGQHTGACNWRGGPVALLVTFPL